MAPTASGPVSDSTTRVVVLRVPAVGERQNENKSPDASAVWHSKLAGPEIDQNQKQNPKAANERQGWESKLDGLEAKVKGASVDRRVTRMVCELGGSMCAMVDDNDNSLSETMEASVTDITCDSPSEAMKWGAMMAMGEPGVLPDAEHKEEATFWEEKYEQAHCEAERRGLSLPEFTERFREAFDGRGRRPPSDAPWGVGEWALNSPLIDDPEEAEKVLWRCLSEGAHKEYSECGPPMKLFEDKLTGNAEGDRARSSASSETVRSVPPRTRAPRPQHECPILPVVYEQSSEEWSSQGSRSPTPSQARRPAALDPALFKLPDDSWEAQALVREHRWRCFAALGKVQEAAAPATHGQRADPVSEQDVAIRKKVWGRLREEKKNPGWDSRHHVVPSKNNERHENYRSYFDKTLEFDPFHLSEALTHRQTQHVRQLQDPRMPGISKPKISGCDFTPPVKPGSLSLATPHAYTKPRTPAAPHTARGGGRRSLVTTPQTTPRRPNTERTPGPRTAGALGNLKRPAKAGRWDKRHHVRTSKTNGTLYTDRRDYFDREVDFGDGRPRQPTAGSSAWSLYPESRGNGTERVTFTKMGLTLTKASTPPVVSIWHDVHMTNPDPPAQCPEPRQGRFMGRGKTLAAKHSAPWNTRHATPPNASFQESPWLMKRRDPAKFEQGGEYGKLFRPCTGGILENDPYRYDPLLHSTYYKEHIDEQTKNKTRKSSRSSVFTPTTPPTPHNLDRKTPPRANATAASSTTINTPKLGPASNTPKIPAPPRTDKAKQAPRVHTTSISHATIANFSGDNFQFLPPPIAI